MIKRFLLAGIFLSLALLACSSSPHGPLVARFDLYVQDGVADYDSVFVTIDSIFVKPSLDTADWDPIYTYPISVELAHLHNGRQQLLVRRDLEVGEIAGLKLSFSSGRLVVDGVSDDMSLPGMNGDSVADSASAEVLIVKNKVTSAIVDISLFSSISYNESLDFYTFDPHFTFIDIDSTGSIFGSTIPAADIFLFNKNLPDTISYTISEGDSLTFGFYNLPAGQYDLLLRPRGADTLTYDSLFLEDVPAPIGGEYDIGLLDLPHP